MRRLPPFPELVAFEAVARHLSFTRAAQELCVTQSAISHRLRRLEAHFGQPLIRRMNPGLALTDAGAALLPELVAMLDGLARLGENPERKLRVGAGSALCNWWLAGRLPDFMAQHPDLSVELVPILSAAPPMPEVDVLIRWVAPGEDGATGTQVPLFNEQVFPVCSPKLLPDGLPLRNAQALASMTLLHKATQGTGEWTWPVWFDRLGIQAGARVSELRFADIGLVMSATVNGAGVALVRSLLAQDALADGRLVVAVEGARPLVSTKRHVARWARNKSADRDVQAFVPWLVAQAQASLSHTAATPGLLYKE